MQMDLHVRYEALYELGYIIIRGIPKYVTLPILPKCMDACMIAYGNPSREVAGFLLKRWKYGCMTYGNILGTDSWTPIWETESLVLCPTNWKGNHYRLHTDDSYVSQIRQLCSAPKYIELVRQTIIIMRLFAVRWQGWGHYVNLNICI